MTNQYETTNTPRTGGTARRRLAYACVLLMPLGCGEDDSGRDPIDYPNSGVGAQTDDTLHGTDQADLLEGGGGSDRLFGGGGPDELFGGDQGDMLRGEAGDDTLEGEHGPDVLNGGPGDDELRGGLGSDYYVIEAGHGDDVLDDEGGSHDRLTFYGLRPDEVASVQDGSDLVITVPGGSVRIVDHFGEGAIELIDHEWGQDPFTALDYGIYWFGPGNERIKHVPTVDNPYFDPERPTMILTHGLQSGSISDRRRPGLNFGDDTTAPDVDLADAWIDAGWNIGVFYWQNFADEREVKDAEAKIWSSQGRNGLGMRWRSQGGSYQDWPFELSVGELAHGAVTAALLEAQAPTVRLAGHSLGNQLVTVVAGMLQSDVDSAEVSSRLAPARLSLLDPFWSKGSKDYLGGAQTTGSRAHDLVLELLDARVPVDSYRSSGITSTPLAGDSNPALFEDVCLVELRPHYLGWWQIADKHMVGFWHYVMGFAVAETKDDQGGDVATAGASDEVLWGCIDGGFGWDQVGGRNTMTPADDSYERID